ncbi:MAG TPA: hypothetical protein VGN88_06010 [Phycisphaerae bacterium]
MNCNLGTGWRLRRSGAALVIAMSAGVLVGAAPKGTATKGAAQPASAAASAATTKAKKPTLAVLPFVALTGDTKEKDLAQRMRFAVSQKLSSDMNAVVANGTYDRMDNVQIDQLVSALEISFAKAMPDDDEMQKLLGTLETEYTIAGAMKGRHMTLTLYQGGTVTKTAAADIPPDNESPKLAVEKAITDLTGTAFAHIRDVEADHLDAKAEARFASRANLVLDPGFEMAAKDAKKVASNWGAILESDRYAPPLITLAEAEGLAQDRVAVVPVRAAGAALPAASGKESGGGGVEGNEYCLMMRMSKHTAENNGLSCESIWIPVENGKKYRFTAEYHSNGPTARLFLKGFAEKADQFSKKDDPETSRREFYRAQILPRKKNTGWDLIEMDFTPSTVKATDPKIEWMRVDLYIYLTAGDVFFDQVTMKKLDE